MRNDKVGISSGMPATVCLWRTFEANFNGSFAALRHMLQRRERSHLAQSCQLRLILHQQGAGEGQCVEGDRLETLVGPRDHEHPAARDEEIVGSRNQRAGGWGERDTDVPQELVVGSERLRGKLLHIARSRGIRVNQSMSKRQLGNLLDFPGVASPCFEEWFEGDR